MPLDLQPSRLYWLNFIAEPGWREREREKNAQGFDQESYLEKKHYFANKAMIQHFFFRPNESKIMSN